MTATERLFRPVAPGSAVVFRVTFGALMLWATIRFVASGHVAEHFLEPRHFFHYFGFEWVRPLPGAGMYVVYALMGVFAIGVALGLCYRASALLFGLLFAYAQLCDKTHYLNHYYLVAVLALTMAFLPLHAAGSLDARFRPSVRGAMPAWAVAALRIQIGLVYVFAGIAKLQPDWLLHAQPMSIWLAARGIEIPGLAHVASWGAALFDLTVPLWLLWRRTRPFAYAAVVAFHALTAALFNIGLFPWMMIALTPIFFDADWPRRLGIAVVAPAAAPRRSRIPLLLGVHLALQLVLPLRAASYPGDVLWTEEGFRFSWRVMLMEKSGTVELEVRDPDTGRVWQVPPAAYYTRYQAAMMATQPDMILEAAHTAAEDFRARGVRAPEVRAHAYASLNGRPGRLLVDPTVDLAVQTDGFAPKPWILPPN